ncbi:MAG: FAD-dependent oxidoreductase [candidate division KSB1 bacterium]|nr:FAD-dependent oxidoreductase [candidate division KSB1 bacterium]MDZ7394100.1 FAD-dependent oxidoreductase [candidate division KSB1 bacterium]
MARIDSHPILEVPTERKRVRFTFDGGELVGFEGEMLSSALIANGVWSFSHHRRGGAPQGIFCANGQCSHCTMLVDGRAQKTCVTPLRAGMDVRTLRGVPAVPEDDRPLSLWEQKQLTCDVLVIGGGPSGLTASIELAKLGFSVVLVDDKSALGGKLVLQTHKFFGSVEDCYAGTRGVDIARLLARQVQDLPNITVMTNASVVGIYKDRKAGVFVGGTEYVLVAFDGLVVSAGAREKGLIFPGNHLPGVYGAGAFQTLVNRDLVRPAERLFIIGSGNVGLIAAYHALQAGITVVGIADILAKVAGYKVHQDKIKRMGVPIYLSHTILSAEGREHVEQVTIAKVNEQYQPLLDTARTFAVDTLLLAVGLTPIDEFYQLAQRFGFPVVKAGDAEEIAEASSAMFGGRIAGLRLAQMLGKEVQIHPSYAQKMEVLKSPPGDVYAKHPVQLGQTFRPILHCVEEIPCDPCAAVCPSGAIFLRGKKGNLLDPPVFSGECSGCTACVAACPGLAITLARCIDDHWAEVVIPYELRPSFAVGDHLPVMDQEGNFLEMAEVLRIRYNKKYKTHLVTLRVSLSNAPLAAGVRVQRPEDTAPLPVPSLTHAPEAGVVCHCELITLGEVVDFIKKHQVTDVNQLKVLRVGMGACGGKNCSQVLARAFAMAGVEWQRVEKGTVRPPAVEVPLTAILNEAE